MIIRCIINLHLIIVIIISVISSNEDKISFSKKRIIISIKKKLLKYFCMKIIFLKNMTSNDLPVAYISECVGTFGVNAT